MKGRFAITTVLLFLVNDPQPGSGEHQEKIPYSNIIFIRH
jgi:hypothetical protein